MSPVPYKIATLEFCVTQSVDLLVFYRPVWQKNFLCLALSDNTVERFALHTSV